LRYVSPLKSFQCFLTGGIFYAFELAFEAESNKFGYIFIQIDMDEKQKFN